MLSTTLLLAPGLAGLIGSESAAFWAWNLSPVSEVLKYDVSPIWISSPDRPSSAGTANVAWALPAVRSMSAAAVEPAREISAPVPPLPLRSALMLPSRVASTWTLLALCAVRTAAVTISLGSVRAGAAAVPQAETTMETAASRPNSLVTKRVVGDIGWIPPRVV
jgi:hypothetical protein